MVQFQVRQIRTRQFGFGKAHPVLVGQRRYLSNLSLQCPGQINDFGYGDNQIGVELAGHSKNSYTRYSVALVSSNEGGVDLTTDVVPGAPPSNRTYDVNLAFSQAFNGRGESMGLERIGAFSHIGQRPSYYQTRRAPNWWAWATDLFTGRVSREICIYKNLELLPLFMHGHDNVYLGTGSSRPISRYQAGAQAPSFNGGFP